MLGRSVGLESPLGGHLRVNPRHYGPQHSPLVTDLDQDAAAIELAFVIVGALRRYRFNNNRRVVSLVSPSLTVPKSMIK